VFPNSNNLVDRPATRLKGVSIIWLILLIFKQSTASIL